jgi:hypothetical protein
MKTGSSFLILGAMSFLMALLMGWDALRNHYKVRGIVDRLGVLGGRVFYFALGLVFITLGMLLKAGVLVFQ